MSNHFGSLGFGHYTAFAQNWKTGEWYNYDDSSHSRCNESKIVSESAYNLFYRKRNYLDLENIDYDKIRLEGDPSYLNGTKK